MQLHQKYKILKACGIDHTQYKGGETIDISDTRGSLYCALSARLIEGVPGTEIRDPEEPKATKKG